MHRYSDDMETDYAIQEAIEAERYEAWQEEQARLDYEEKYVINEDLEPDYDHDGDNDEHYWDNDGQPDEAQEWYDFDPDC